MLSVRRMREFAHMEVGERCEGCGRTEALDAHHRDGNPMNNARANLLTLCRGCHMKAHARVIPCRICGKPQRGLGLCNKHYIRLKKWGNPLAVKVNQNTPLAFAD